MRPHVLVTGASAGIGEALARAYAGRGAAVSLVARRKERLERLAQELGGEALPIAADLSDPDQVEGVVARAQKALGPVDVLVNNAGQQIIARAFESNVAACEAMVRLDLLSPLRLTLAVLPGMLERRSGTIIDISSMAGLTPTPGMLYYSAAKAGLAAASDVLRAELRGSGVHVLAVFPGPVNTDLGERGKARFGTSFVLSLVPFGDPAELAQRVLRAAERKKSRLIYPRIYAVAEWFPGIARWVTGRFTPEILPEAREPSARLE